MAYSAALYMRLSKDDEGRGESASITAQRKMLINYAQAQGFEVYKQYADAAAIIGLNQKPEANGRRFSPFSLVSAHFKANGGCNCLI